METTATKTRKCSKAETSINVTESSLSIQSDHFNKNCDQINNNGKTRIDSKGKTRRVIIAPEPQDKNQMYVFFDGPFSDGGASAHDGDERPFWIIKLATDLDAEAKYAYRVWNFEKALALADKLIQPAIAVYPIR